MLIFASARTRVISLRSSGIHEKTRQSQNADRNKNIIVRRRKTPLRPFTGKIRGEVSARLQKSCRDFASHSPTYFYRFESLIAFRQPFFNHDAKLTRGKVRLA